MRTALASTDMRAFVVGIFLILLACYTYFFPRWADWNQNSRFDLIVSLVDDGTLSIDRRVANTGDYAELNGHYYSDKAPGLALLGVPVYAGFRSVFPPGLLDSAEAAVATNPALAGTARVGQATSGDNLIFFLGLTVTTFVTTALPAAVLGVVFFWLTGELGLRLWPRFWATLLYCLATSAFPYANTFVGHQTVAFLLFAAFALLFAIRHGRRGPPWIIVVGFLLGYAVISEYQTVLIGCILALYALGTLGRRVATVARLMIGALPPMVLLVIHDVAAFGTPLPVGYLHSTLWSNLHEVGFVSITYPHLEAFWGITFAADRGLFFLSPFLLWSVVGYRALWRQHFLRAEFWVLVLVPVVYGLFNASSAMWQGGFGVGPRYLVASLAFLGVAAGFGMQAGWRRPRLRPVIGLMAAWSFGAVWAETVAGQSFPDYTPNPLVHLSLPLLAQGDIARNAGMLLHLGGWASIIPLHVFVIAVLTVVLRMRPRQPSICPDDVEGRPTGGIPVASFG